MTTVEEARVLRYLQRHMTARVADLLGVCLPGAPLEWVHRALAELEWLGYIAVYYGRNGVPVAVAITDKGSRCSRP